MQIILELLQNIKILHNLWSDMVFGRGRYVYILLLQHDCQQFFFTNLNQKWNKQF